MGKPMYLTYFKVVPNVNVNLIGKKHPYYGKSMSANFLGSQHMMGFVGFSRKSIF